ncbi:MAG: hypothetical protein AB1426_08805 [Bacillota bacterium]
MRRFFPSLEQSIIWAVGGIIYAWVTLYFISVFEPTREWLYHDSPFRDYYHVIRRLSPAEWAMYLAAKADINPLLGIALGTFFGAALGYLLRTAIRIIFRR